MTLRFPASFKVIGRSAVDWWDSWIDMVVITLLWFVAQLTVILGPPATFGYYYVIQQMLNGESLGARGLIQGARRFFGKSWQWGALNLLAVLVLAYNFQFYGSIKASWGLYLQVLTGMVIFLYMSTTFYGLAYFMALEQHSLRIALKNGFLTTLAAPLYSLILFVFSLLVGALSGLLVLPLALGLPGLVPICGFRAMEDRLIAFGLRKRERTPKEIEAAQGRRIFVPGRDNEDTPQDKQ